MVEEWLLGFDAREWWLDVEREWDASRRGEQALTFREITERRVPEHAPFFVFGLWLIEAVGWRGGDDSDGPTNERIAVEDDNCRRISESARSAGPARSQ